MRIGVVSDTHMPRFGRELPRALVEGLRSAGVERIVHCGDFTSPEVADLLERIAPLDAVAGNNDGPALVARFGRRRIIELGGVRIGVVHGDEGPGRTTAQRAQQAFAGDAVGVILFGHSHIPLVERLPAGCWLVNPGSPTDKRRQPRFSWALLELDGVQVSPRLLYFDDRSTEGLSTGRAAAPTARTTGGKESRSC